MESWDALLRAPAPCAHVIQLYTDDAFLSRAVAHFLASGFSAGDGAIVVATPEHTEAILRAVAHAHDPAALRRRGQLLLLDARTCLGRFMVDGLPDRARFLKTVEDALARVRDRVEGGIRLFGEMVDLLWDHNLPGTVKLEELWNEVLAAHGVSLLCAYRMDNFDRHLHRGVLHQLTRCHSHLVPVEDYERFERAVDRAYGDVFGARGDAALLRQLLARADGSTATMPSGQQALVALRNLRRDLADEVLERARVHYLHA